MSNLERLTEGGDKQADAIHKFHFELGLSDSQIKNTEYAVGAVSAVALGLIALRTGKLQMLEKAMPAIEEAANGIRADVLRLTNAAPKLNYYQLKNGLELQLSEKATVYGKTADLISITHPIDGEAHLLKDGSRIVSRYDCNNFYDEAGRVIHMGFPSKEMPTISFQNEAFTPGNIELYKRVENCFLTGSMKSLERQPQLFDHASKFWWLKFER